MFTYLLRDTWFENTEYSRECNVVSGSDVVLLPYGFYSRL